MRRLLVLQFYGFNTCRVKTKDVVIREFAKAFPLSQAILVRSEQGPQASAAPPYR